MTGARKQPILKWGRGLSVLVAVLAVSLSFGVQAVQAQNTRKKPPAPPPREAAQKKPVTSPGETKAVLNEITRKLFMAVELNDMPMVKSSIEAGADLFQQNADGMTAADLAVDKGHFIVAHYLLSRRLVGASPPVALLPGKADKAIAAVEAKPKRTFSKPPQKPKKSPQVKTKPKTKTKTGTKTKPPAPPPAAPEEKPSAVPEPEAVAEAPPASVPPAAPGTVTEPAGEADKPLAKKGIGAFFTSLVELITPGGEKPPKQKKDAPEKVAVAEPEKATEETDIITVIDPDLLADGLGQQEPGKDAPDSSAIVETVVEDPDEIVVDVTGDREKDTTGDGPIVELIDEDPAKLEETGLETMIADLEEPGKKTAKKSKSKPIKEEGFLDKLAGMFSSDKKTGKPEMPSVEEVKGPTPEEVAAYDLPLPEPKPQAPKKFSPRFMDRLADFLEGGKEEEFKAWLPKMQIINGGIPPGAPSATPPRIPSNIPSNIPGGKAATEAPVPKKAPKAIVERLPLPESLMGKIPGAAPEKMTADKPLTDKGLFKGAFDKLVDVLTPDFASKDRQQRVILEPEEKLAQGGSKASTKEGEKKVEEPPGFWPVTEVETAQAPIVAIRKPTRIAYDDKALKGVILSLGQSVSLENSFPPAGDGTDPFNRCVKKNRGTTLFCLETVDWPENMQADFLVPTILYTGQKAIVRYDQGIASRFHALFPTESFKRVAAYFHKRFGPPTDVWNRSIAPFAKPRQDNPTLAWRSIDPKTSAVTVLEIRKYDDSRGGFPDTNRGAVMLYLANTPSIFPQVSSHELMRLSRARMNAPTGEPVNQLPTPKAMMGAPGEKPKADPRQMTAEEMQVERRKRKAAEKAGATAKPEEDLFALPPDPEGR